MVVDHYVDNGKLLGIDLSDFVKTAEAAGGDFSYAWPEKQLFPLHTPEDTLLSALYAYKQKELVPEEVQEKIAEALEHHGLTEEFIKIAKKLTPEERERLPDSVFGLVVKDPKTGKKIRKYPMPDPEHVRAAIVYFKKNYRKYPEEWRRQIARKIVEQAKKFGIEVHDELILRYAGVARANLAKAAELLREYRVNVLWDNEKARQAYETVAEAFEKFAEAELPEGELERAVKGLEELDRTFGVNYDRLPTPQLIVYNEKLAEETVKLVEKEVPLAVLQAIPDDAYKELIGTVPNRQTLKEDIESLPTPEKEILEQFLIKEELI